MLSDFCGADEHRDDGLRALPECLVARGIVVGQRVYGGGDVHGVVLGVQTQRMRTGTLDGRRSVRRFRSPARPEHERGQQGETAAVGLTDDDERGCGFGHHLGNRRVSAGRRFAQNALT